MTIKSIKISLYLTILTIFIVLGSLGFYFIGVQAENIEYEIGGWLWTETYGWISLSSDNHQFLDNNYYSGPEYGLKLNSNNISGWAWSSNVGWICFGSTCNISGCGSNSPNGGWFANLLEGNKIIGWAKVVSLCEDGWMHLGLGAPIVASSGVDCYDCKYNTSTPPEMNCKTCFTETKFNNQNIPEGSNGVIGGSGGICFGCTDCKRSQDLGLKIFRTECDNCSSCHQYGVARDSDSGELIGWAWGSGKSKVDGPGWINFSGKAGIVYPWLETLYGSVYAKNEIRQKSLISGINATYCLFASDIVNFNTRYCDQQQLTDFDFGVDYLSGDNKYKNILGRLDLVGLTTKTKEIDETNYNKYDNIIDEITGSVVWNSSIILNNKVFVINGDLTIENGFSINNGSGNQRGNGLVVVNGNLKINSSFDYETFVNQDFKQIASIGWIVKGDVIVDRDVEKIVGGFIILGGNVDCRYENGSRCDGVDYPKYQKNGYGIFFSGQSNKKLVVSGLIMAKAFDFRRIYSSVLEGSERIIYDGRLLVNPPPGMKAFLENLPLIKN